MPVSLINDMFILRGYHHEYLPAQFQQLLEGYSKTQERYVSLAMSPIAIVHKPQEDEDRPGADLRVAPFTAWEGVWDGEAWADPVLYGHMKSLYESDLPFWIQFDSHMSRNFDTLFPISEDRKTWATSTWPIAPFGTTPAAPTTHNGNLFVDGFVVTDGVTIDDETGVVYFETAPDEDAAIYFRYTWRAYVRIAQFDFAALEGGQGNTTYVGRALFEMVAPNYSDDPWPITVNSWSAEAGDPYPATGADPDREVCTTPFAPASLSSVARAGSTDAWTDPTNARYVDSSYASIAALGVGDKAEYLRPLFSPPIDIPADATLTRARLGVKGYVDPVSGLSIDIIDDSVFLTNNGVQVGANKATDQPVPRADSWRWYDWDLTSLGLTVADMESGLIGADIGFKASPASYSNPDWAITYEYDGQSYTTRPTSSIQTEWDDSTDLDVTVDQTEQADGQVVAQQDGTVRVVATYIGGGTAPDNIFVQVYSKARAYTDDADEITALVDNGQGDAGVFAVGNDATSEGTHTYKLAVVDGVASKSLQMFAQASRSFIYSETDDPQARALLEVTGTVVAYPTSDLYVGAVTLNICWQNPTPVDEGSGDESYISPEIQRSDFQWSKGWLTEPYWREGYGEGTCGCLQDIDGNGAGIPSGNAFGAGTIVQPPTTGDFWISGEYEAQDNGDMASTSLLSDNASGDNTTDESNPEGAATAGTKELTAIKAFSSGVDFDRIKIVAGWNDDFEFAVAYSDDMVTWIPFDGSPPITGPGSGAYTASAQLEQTTTPDNAKYFRVSARCSVGGFGTQKVGLFDFRVFDGVTERTP